ncbi:MAG: GNAT family N-acetyltransferase [Clostridia bacterium]|nr:GNAT family N-acetyltransferase [Clostridia bacterium]
MKEISIEKAISILKNNIIEYAMEIDNLNYVSKDKTKCLDFENAFVIITKEKETFIRIIPINALCDYNEIWEQIKNNENICLSVNVYNENEENVRGVFEKHFDSIRVAVDYVFVNRSEHAINGNIRILVEEDKDAFVSMENTPQQYRPPLNILFSVFVTKRSGEIIAYYDGERILGYLSYNSLFGDVYDVDYIYVSPSHRGKGIGKQLANAYASIVKGRGGIAYWSNAKNIVSEKTAKSAGFVLIRKALIFK